MQIYWRHSRLHTRIFVFSNAVLSTASPLYNTLLDASIIENASLTAHSTLWDELSPTFSNVLLVSLGHGCFFSLLVLTCENLHLLSACASSKTKFVERTRQKCLNAVVHL